MLSVIIPNAIMLSVLVTTTSITLIKRWWLFQFEIFLLLCWVPIILQVEKDELAEWF